MVGILLSMQECCIYTRCRFVYRSWIHIWEYNERQTRTGWNKLL